MQLLTRTSCEQSILFSEAAGNSLALLAATLQEGLPASRLPVTPSPGAAPSGSCPVLGHRVSGGAGAQPDRETRHSIGEQPSRLEL